jgi:hypothetical protein
MGVVGAGAEIAPSIYAIPFIQIPSSSGYVNDDDDPHLLFCRRTSTG